MTRVRVTSKTGYKPHQAGRVTSAQGRPEQAVRLFGAAAVLRETTRASLPPAHRAEYDRRVAAARAALDETTFAVAWEEGRALSLEQAVTFALEETSGTRSRAVDAAGRNGKAQPVCPVQPQ